MLFRSKSQFEQIDPTPDTVFFKVKVPEFILGTDRYLLLDNSDSLKPYPASIADDTTRERPAAAKRMNYFRNVLSNIVPPNLLDTFLVGEKNKFPSIFELSKYSVVILVSEKKFHLLDLPAGRKLYFDNKVIDGIAQYLNLGGKMIISSWDLYYHIQPINDNPKNFYRNTLHFSPDSNLTALKKRDCIGAYPNPIFGYPEITVDTTKVLKNTTTGVYAVDSIITGRATGFGEVIYFYNSFTNGPTKPMGIRYIGPEKSYRIIYFGFPLFYTYRETAEAVLRKAITDIQQP